MSITSTGLSDHEVGTALETGTSGAGAKPGIGHNMPPAGMSLEATRRVAQRLGVSVRTVQRWVAAGILDPPIKVNNRNYHRAGVMPKPDEPDAPDPT